ncbi:MAG: 3-deoxy-7-phosphoheptulonate synthase [Capsulimonadales bacterium]|nr:3-deoxy-7-phosphoheptulonate synthase [Capsulimonadales bacterium]
MSAALKDEVNADEIESADLLPLLMGKVGEIEPPVARRTPLPPPAELQAEIPLTRPLAETVLKARCDLRRVLNRQDPRLLVIVGHCSIHDPEAALDYARRLAALQKECPGRLLFVMRAYFEKPRTTVGWRGLINDPQMDGSFDMAEGLRQARRLLRELTALGLPVATEVLDLYVPDYLTDFLSFAAIGARTTESQPHRALASGLPVAVGFKNGTDGGTRIALDALVSAGEPHSYLGPDSEGRCTIVRTRGNRQTLVILRGGKVSGPNYQAHCLESIESEMEAIGVAPNILVDCSHGNSGYDPEKQVEVAESVVASRRAGRRSVVGLMLESHLFAGKQALIPGRSGDLRYGVSVTDGCLGWEATAALLRRLHAELG